MTSMTWPARLSLCLLLVVALGHPGRVVASPPIPVTGIVLDADGTPLAGAEARLQRLPEPYRRGRLLLAGRVWLRPEATARTGPGGRFRIPAPSAGPWQVVVHAPGRVAMEQPIWALMEATELVPVTLRSAVSVRVRVEGPDGGPVKGAEVVVHGSGGGRRGQPEPGLWVPVGLRAATTGSDGSVVVPAERGERLRVAAVAGRRTGTLERHRPVAGSGETIVVRLEEVPVREIEVVDGDGGPIPRAVVVGEGRLPIALALTDETGRAAVPLRDGAGKRDGRGTAVRVEAPDGSGWAGELALPEPAEEPPRPMRIRVEPPAEIAGRVVAAGTGAVLAGAWAFPSGAADRARETDRNGVFRLPWRAAPGGLGRATVFAFAPGYLSNHVAVDPASRELAVIELEPAAYVTGIVVDREGHPVVDAEVRLIPRWPVRPDAPPLVNPGPEGYARSGPDGRFRIAPVDREWPYLVTADAAGYAPLEVPLPEPPEGSALVADLRLVLGSGGRLRGRVVTPEGEPIAGAKAVVAPEVEGVALGETLPMTRAVSDSEGVFTMAELPAGAAGLAVGAAGQTLRGAGAFEIPADGGEVDVGDVVLEPEAVLEGRIVDPRGDGVAGAVVNVTSPGPRSSPETQRAYNQLVAPVIVDEEGRFRAGQLRAGVAVHLWVSAPGYQDTMRHGLVLPLDEPLTIELTPEISVHGEVVDGGGRPVAGGRVTAGSEADDGSRFSTQVSTDPSGRFHVELPRSRTLTFTVTGPSYVTREPVVLEISPDEVPPPVRIEVVEGGRLSGRVVSSTGAAIDRGTVRAWWSEGDGRGVRGTDVALAPGGTFVFEGLPLRQVDLVVDAEGYPQDRRTVNASGPSPWVEIVLEPGVEVSGWVVDSADRPAASAEVRLSAQDRQTGRPLQTRTDGQGAFRFVGVGPKAYDLEVRLPGTAQGLIRAVTVEDRPVAGVVVRIPETGCISGRLSGLDDDGLAWVTVFVVSRYGRVPARILLGGRYEADGLVPGSWQVIGQVTGHVGAEGPRTTKTVTLGPGDDVVVDLSFPSGGGVEPADENAPEEGGPPPGR